MITLVVALTFAVVLSITKTLPPIEGLVSLGMILFGSTVYELTDAIRAKK